MMLVSHFLEFVKNSTDTHSLVVSGLRFSVDGRTYPNNSVTSLWNVGENDKALSCITDYAQCCSAFPYRQGEFYYPNGERVRILGTGDGMYRNRGNQEIRLNRKKDVTFPFGRFRCELPNANGIIQSIYINLSRKEIVTPIILVNDS